MKDKENVNSGHRDRLRERFFSVGLEGFKPHEVLELLLFTVYPRVDTKVIAKKVLDYFDNDFHKMLNAEKAEYEGLKLSNQAIALIKIVREISIYQLKLEMKQRKKISSTHETIDFLRAYYKGIHKEEFLVIYLDNQNRIIDVKSEFQGTFNEAKIYVRELIKQCLKYNASSIIISHNHPSGGLEPTSNDINITNKIKMALGFVEIRLLDHILIGDNEYYSFAEWGHL
ncbi:MAG: DNA repair protein RadC [Candidatus Cloacimonetes bacterium]|nr:DNA repair protein RadC [Candidatus Cloacimonadota bacterium]